MRFPSGPNACPLIPPRCCSAGFTFPSRPMTKALPSTASAKTTSPLAFAARAAACFKPSATGFYDSPSTSNSCSCGEPAGFRRRWPILPQPAHGVGENQRGVFRVVAFLAPGVVDFVARKIRARSMV